MDKLAEREAAAPRPLVGAPALAVQFFLIPLAVVALTILVYAGFRTLLNDDRSVQDYLTEIRTGGDDRRWPAAYELSRLMADPSVRSDTTVGPAVVAAFEKSKGDDPRVRRYLALAIGRLDAPRPANAVPMLIDALDEPDNEMRINVMWALGSLGDETATPKLQDMYASTDPGVRKMSVYALGALPGSAQLPTLETALNDPAVDVQWNAAVALARHGSRVGAPVLRRMLDRAYVQNVVKRPNSPTDDIDPIGEVMVSSLQAASTLKDPSLRDVIRQVSEQDPNLRVRQAAMETLKILEST
jgi:hypothetical protein